VVPGSGFNLGFQIFFHRNRKKESSTNFVVVGWIVGLDIIEDSSNSPAGGPSQHFRNSSDLLQIYRKHKTVYLALAGEAAKVGLKINEQKTKYMIAARNDRTICDVGQSVSIGDKHFEVVKEFVYLGSLMTTTKNSDCK
jgi:hypothetical protein